MSSRIFPTPQDAEAAFYEALEHANLEDMMSVWAEDEEIVCVHPTGPRLSGHDEVRASWAKIFAGGPGMRVRITRQVTLSGMMIAVHSVQEEFSAEGETRARNATIATNVYLRSAAGWRMLVHHASLAPRAAETVAAEPSAKILH